MRNSLEPQVLRGQELKVSLESRIIDRMVLDKNDPNTLFARRLHTALDKAGVVGGRGRQTAVGKMFGISQKGAAKWLRGEGMPKIQRIKEIADRLQVRGEWLLTGSGTMTNHDSNYNQMTVKQPLEGWVPLLINSHIKHWLHHGGEMNADDLKTWVPCPLAHSTKTFAIRYHGNSMESVLTDGEWVCIDPEKTPVHNCIVYILTATGSALLRTLLIEQDGSRFLMAANSAWPERVTELLAEHEIIGVAIFKGKEL